MSARDFCTVTASTKRNADLGSGQIGAAATNVASLLITPLYPLEGGTVTALGLDSPRQYRECYHVPAAGGALPDVLEGDLLVVSSVEYPVQYVNPWTDGDIPSLHIVVQKVQGT